MSNEQKIILLGMARSYLAIAKAKRCNYYLNKARALITQIKESVCHL